MANQLTGDFDAVLQVSVPTVNRLLASMHQNRGDDIGPAPPHTLPHRVVVSIGDKPLGGSLAGIKGTAQVQIGVPSVTLIADAPRAANVSCWIRARYNPYPKSVSLPEFIHGRIVARFDAGQLNLAKLFGAAFIYAAASSDDANIKFTESKLGFAESEKVAALIRDYLRTRGTAVLGLPTDVPPGTFDFQALTDGQGRQAVALAIMLEGTAPGGGTLGQIFLDGSDFAIAISKEGILARIQPSINDFNQAPKPTFSITIYAQSPWGTKYELMTAHYTVSMTAKADWNGALTLRVSGAAETSHLLFPNATFNISQGVTFELDASAQAISITPSGAPNVDVDVGEPYNHVSAVEANAENTVTTRFVQERDKALAGANEQINKMLGAVLEQGRKLLRKMDDMAEIALASVLPRDDGVLVTGKISLSPRGLPRVAFSPLADGSGYTAYDSWVPGGWIKQFVWTFWRVEDAENYDPEYDTLFVPYNPTPLDDRFILRDTNVPGITPPGPLTTAPMPIGPSAAGYVVTLEGIKSLILKDPPGIWSAFDGQVCLWLAYEYVDPVSGTMLAEYPIPFAGIGAVKALNPGIGCLVASGHEWYYPPKEMPGPCPGWNVIVVQPAEGGLVSSIELLQAVRQAERPDAPIMLIFALPISARGPNPALAAQAREFRRNFPQVGLTLADRNGRWLRGLDLPTEDSRPALRLVDPDGRLAWRHDGVADATTIAAALREHLVAAPPPTVASLQARVRPGRPPPDFSFEATAGDRIALHHLLGRRLAILFVAAGHAALEAVLRRVPASTGETDKPHMIVIIVQDGEPGGTATPRGLGFDGIVVPDPEGAIARSYGITVRPTVVLVDRDGRVSSVQLMSSVIATPRRASAGRGAERG